MIELVFFLIGLVMLIGFFSSVFFERTKIPDALILMLVGVVLGLVFNIADQPVFISLAEYVGAIALIMILFEGGMNLNLFKVMTELYEATSFTLFVFSLTTLTITVFMNLFFGWDVLYGMLLGAVIGGTSSAVVIPIVSKLTVDDKTNILLSLESALTDALCIVTAITLLQAILSATANIPDALHNLLSAFSIAAVVALIVGVFWISVLQRFYGKAYGYLLTIAVIFILYSSVEFVQGNGAIAALVFGLVLGNANEIARAFRMEGTFWIDRTIKTFQKEVSFFVRTFFFVYLGLIFHVRELNLTVISMVLIAFAAVLLSRAVSVRLLVNKNPALTESRVLLTTMMPRGLAAAVLAYTVSQTTEVVIPYFIEIAIAILVLSNLTATIGSFAYERDRRKKERASEEKAREDEENKPALEKPLSVVEETAASKESPKVEDKTKKKNEILDKGV